MPVSHEQLSAQIDEFRGEFRELRTLVVGDGGRTKTSIHDRVSALESMPGIKIALITAAATVLAAGLSVVGVLWMQSRNPPALHAVATGGAT